MKRVPFIRIGLLIAASPILIAFIASLFQGGSMFNEGTGTGAYLWLLFLTIPTGGLILLLGIIKHMRFFWQKNRPTQISSAPHKVNETNPIPIITSHGKSSGITATSDEEDYTYDVVGESFQHDHLVQLVQNHKAVNDGSVFTVATLKLQSDNVFDSYAVMVIIEGLQVGYIAKSHSQEMTNKLKALGTEELDVPAHLGWDTDNPQPYIGVKLMLGDLDPSI